VRPLVEIALLAGCFTISPLCAQDAKDGPKSEKAHKTFNDALVLLREGKEIWALDGFKKADKQDRGQCQACQIQIKNLLCKISHVSVIKGELLLRSKERTDVRKSTVTPEVQVRRRASRTRVSGTMRRSGPLQNWGQVKP